MVLQKERGLRDDRGEQAPDQLCPEGTRAGSPRQLPQLSAPRTRQEMDWAWEELLQDPPTCLQCWLSFKATATTTVRGTLGGCPSSPSSRSLFRTHFQHHWTKTILKAPVLESTEL